MSPGLLRVGAIALVLLSLIFLTVAREGVDFQERPARDHLVRMLTRVAV